MKTFFHFTDSTDSTNKWAMSELANVQRNEIHVFCANWQYSGRGQGANIWESTKNENILLSLLLKNIDIPIKNQFSLSHVLAITAQKYVENEIKTDNVRIKWPNDIVVGNRKIAGMLSENIVFGKNISSVVSGIGININQASFHKLQNIAISLFNIDNKKRNIKDEIVKFIDIYRFFYNELMKNRYESLLETYNALLWKKDENIFFDFFTSVLKCKILGTNLNGQIILSLPNGYIKAFYHHEAVICKKNNLFF